MHEEDASIPARQQDEPFTRYRKILVCDQEPGAEASQGHLDARKRGVPVAEHKRHEGVSLAAAVLNKKQCQYGIEYRGSEDKGEQHHCVMRRAVDIDSVCLASSTKPLASPTIMQGTAEGCGMHAAIRLAPAFAAKNGSRVVHAVLYFLADAAQICRCVAAVSPLNG